MLTRDEFYVQNYLNPPRRGHAVVIGGSMAGLMAARVLSGHYERVTVLERDELPDEPAPRKGLPQARHAHGLLERGRRILEWYLPGVGEEVLQAGGEMSDATRDLAMLSPAGWYFQCPSDMVMLASSRNLLDWVVRERVRSIPNIRIRTGIDVVGLVRGEGTYADVGGVRIRA
ncbi:FAD-dependent oxidoreductase [Singulisphaera sp. PoT]|uniref:FAD-dependent oxidoreductase n=1 Tax=Singulisphaera sp. PoT TaxID=3411797 RepID=UPI003BF534FA